MTGALLVASNITDPQWWKAALERALRNAIVVALPYLGANH